MQPNLFNQPELEVKGTNSFHNTISLKGDALKDSNRNCGKQELRILGLVESGSSVTPFELLDLYNGSYPKIPITSVRRALTCLTDKGFFVKTQSQKSERYGKPNYEWKKL